MQFTSPIRQSASLVGAKDTHQQRSPSSSSSAPSSSFASTPLAGLSAAKNYFFSSPTVVPQRYVKETDSITRRASPLSDVSLVGFLTGKESDPFTVQLNAPDGCGSIFQLFCLCMLVAAHQYVHGKSCLQLLSASSLGLSTFGLIAGVLSRALLTALPDSSRKRGDFYTVAVAQAATIATLASCIIGRGAAAVVCFSLARNILVTRYSGTPARTAAPSPPVEEVKNKGLLYNSGIGASRSKQF